MSADLGAAAVELAEAGWEVFPLRDKVPAIAGGSGLLDATTDVGQVRAWWQCYRGANIGARVPENRVVLDVDPRADGHQSLARLEQTHRPLPPTLTAYSGRGDGGRHLHWLAPPGALTDVRLGTGLELKTRSGYVVMPPSLHPATGQPYTWAASLVPVRRMPFWLAEIVTRPTMPARSRSRTTHGDGSALVRFVARQDERSENRNKGLFWACCRAAETLAGPALDAALDQLVAAAVATGLDQREADRTAQSARQRCAS
jgi:Bifunctional DNA primase/polymerase, N-terminal